MVLSFCLHHDVLALVVDKEIELQLCYIYCYIYWKYNTKLIHFCLLDV